MKTHPFSPPSRLAAIADASPNLRDLFAMSASECDIKHYLKRHCTVQSQRAHARYEFADSMLKAREEA
jgi:hypothetical protein